MGYYTKAVMHARFSNVLGYILGRTLEALYSSLPIPALRLANGTAVPDRHKTPSPGISDPREAPFKRLQICCNNTQGRDSSAIPSPRSHRKPAPSKPVKDVSDAQTTCRPSVVVFQGYVPCCDSRGRSQGASVAPAPVSRAR